MFSDPTFWVAIDFVVFIAVLYRPVGRLLGTALDKRAETIRSELDSAQALREEAQKALAEYKRLQRDAVQEAEEIVERAKHETAALREQAEKELTEQLARREQVAVEKIQQAEAVALKEIRNQAVDLAVAATRRLLVEQVDEKGAGALVDKAIDELPSRLS